MTEEYADKGMARELEKGLTDVEGHFASMNTYDVDDAKLMEKCAQDLVKVLRSGETFVFCRTPGTRARLLTGLKEE